MAFLWFISYPIHMCNPHTTTRRHVSLSGISGCLVLMTLGGLGGSVRADDQAEARVILDRAVRALGGQANLAKFQGATWTARGTVFGFDQEIAFTGGLSLRGPDRFRLDADLTLTGQAVPIKYLIVFAGTKGWWKINDNTMDLDEPRLAEEREKTYRYWVTTLLPIGGGKFKLSCLGEVRIGDHDAVGLLVSHPGHRDLDLFFDQKTGLLLKSAMRVKDPAQGTEMTEEIYYGDYQETDGLRHARTQTVKRDDKRYLEIEVSDFQPVEILDDSLFTRP
jgi:hypothetical protein